MILFLRRGNVNAAPENILVTIGGNGNASYCYATINKTKYYKSAQDLVTAGDTILVYVGGLTCSVIVNGTTVSTARNASYEYIVPSNISSLGINLSYSSTSATSKITFTTS